MNLWRVPLDEQSGKARGPAEPVTTPATNLAHPTIAADGLHIGYVSAEVSINIQRLTFDPTAGVVVGEPTAVTTGSRQWSSPDPSPDGKWVAFYTLNQPEGHIYIARSDGSALRQLTSDTAIDRLPRWSPDGKWLAFFSTRAGPLHVWMIRPDGSDLKRVSGNPAAYMVWSPDGKRIMTRVGSGGPVTGQTVGIIDAQRSPVEQHVDIMPAAQFGRFFPNSWSPDGLRIAGQVGAVGAAGSGIAVFSLPNRRYEKLTEFGEWPVWLPDSQRLLFVAGGNSFYVLDTRTKAVHKVFTVVRDVLGPPRLTRDGRALYFSRRVTEADVWMATLR